MEVAPVPVQLCMARFILEADISDQTASLASIQTARQAIQRALRIQVFPLLVIDRALQRLASFATMRKRIASRLYRAILKIA